MDDWAERKEQEALDAALRLAPGLGWGPALVDGVGRELGMSRGDMELLFPNGPRDLAALLSRRHDAKAMEALAELDPATLKVRERIFKGVEARLEAAAADADAVRRCIAYLALPLNTPLALKLCWETADRIWRWAGDTATDENHYSKRAILSAILIPAMGVRLNQSRDAAADFVRARIENVMAYEKWKAGVKPGQAGRAFAATLGRMRYGSR